MWEREVFIPLLTDLCKLQEPSGKRKFLSDLWLFLLSNLKSPCISMVVLTLSCRFGWELVAWGMAEKKLCGGRKQQLEPFAERSVNCYFFDSPECLLTWMSAEVFENALRSGHTHEEQFKLCSAGERTPNLQRSPRQHLICINIRWFQWPLISDNETYPRGHNKLQHGNRWFPHEISVQVLRVLSSAYFCWFRPVLPRNA